MTTAGEHVLPPLLASFLRRYPDIDLALDVGTREQVWAMLAAHEADLVIAGRPPRSLEVVVRAVRRNELIVVGSPDLPLPSGVLGARWLMREPGSGTRATCEALLAELDVDPPSLTLGANGAVVAGAVAGLGVTLVSRDAVRGQLNAGEPDPADGPAHAARPPVARPHLPSLDGGGALVSHLLDQDEPTARWRVPRPPPAGLTPMLRQNPV